MSKKLITASSILMLLVLVLTASGSPAVVVRQQDARQMASTEKFDAHYRVPNDVGIALLLEEEGVPLSALSVSQQKTMIQDYKEQFVKKNPDTPNPEKLRKLLEKERPVVSARTMMSAGSNQSGGETDRSIKSLVVLMEFNPAEETWTSHVDAEGNCVDTTVTMAGPLHNEIPAPGPRDNNTIWYQDTTPELYNEIYFGEGPEAGVIVQHPNLGEVDLRGKTMVNYYLEMSGGKFAPAGMIYPKWFQAQHSEGWYGEDGCGGSHNVRAGNLVLEAIGAVQADTPGFDWQGLDGNGDGIVDNFTVIHAGMGQEAGGGAQGNFSIWSHASMVGWPDGVLVCEMGSAGCPDRDIRVKEYSMDPENIDLGVIAEEFGHAAFGLPDLYTTDAQGSISNWAIMESGSWNGILGGMEPAPFPLWFKYILGWANVQELDYDSPATVTKVGQLLKTPKGTYTGLKINLPDKEIVVENPLGTGQAWWSDLGDGVNYTLTRAFDLAGVAAPVFSFASYWSIEEDWDYGYVEVSTDGGATWELLPDMDGFFTTTDPNGNNLGVGLTGEGQGTLRFDLAAYAGQAIQLRLLYGTDAAVQENGWFVDDFALADGETVLWSDDIEAGMGGWDAVGWKFVPFTNIFPRYYLVEWRNNQGFDHGLQYPYSTVYSDDDEWEVDRAPYTVPGMLVYLRDTSYSFDYTLYDSIYDAPSWGNKHALLLVDSHFWPYTWDTVRYTSGAYYRANARVQPGNASFTLQETTPFTLRLGTTGGTVLETKTFGPQPAVSVFHDSLGYYPGFYFNGDGYLYWWDKAASMVVPAKGDYSTRITWLDQTPLTELFGIDVGGTVLGTGNPGDDGVQYGLHIAVLDKRSDGSAARILTWNSPALTKVEMTGAKKVKRAATYLNYQVKVSNITPMAQTITLTDVLPENTVLMAPTKGYTQVDNTLVWTGTLQPGQVKIINLTLLVSPGTPAGTVFTNSVFVDDDAIGSSATMDIE